jgi:outer membrane protein OmpA-like peptidoglycan-associated protein
MKLRVLVLALASASSALPNSAQAADDFCSRLIVQAVSQFCQLLPNGLNLCQPVALVGPNPECATPERQALVPVPLGPPTLQLPTPWGAPYARGSWPATMAAIPAAGMPLPTQYAGGAPATAPTPPDLPRIMAAEHKPLAAAMPLAPLPPVAPVVPSPVAAAVKTPTAPPAPVIAPVAIPAPRTATTPTAAAAPVAVATPVTTAPASAPQAAPDAARTAAIETAAAAEEAADALTHFEFDSATLTDAGRAVLDAWVAHAPTDKPVRLSGHADRLGPEPYNLNLSLRRAEAVKQYLVGKGVNPRRIQLEAKGEAEPVKRCKGGATSATKACLAPNRRVEIDPE